jgi:hypothetical protein
MSTLRMPASHLPEASVVPSFGRFFSFITAALDVFAEAQEMARAANKRHPFFAE